MPATSQPAHPRLRYRQRKPRRYRRVHDATTLPQHLHRRVGRMHIRSRHHRVAAIDRQRSPAFEILQLRCHSSRNRLSLRLSQVQFPGRKPLHKRARRIYRRIQKQHTLLRRRVAGSPHRPALRRLIKVAHHKVRPGRSISGTRCIADGGVSPPARVSGPSSRARSMCTCSGCSASITDVSISHAWFMPPGGDVRICPNASAASAQYDASTTFSSGSSTFISHSAARHGTSFPPCPFSSSTLAKPHRRKRAAQSLDDFHIARKIEAQATEMRMMR